MCTQPGYSGGHGARARGIPKTCPAVLTLPATAEAHAIEKYGIISFINTNMPEYFTVAALIYFTLKTNKVKVKTKLHAFGILLAHLVAAACFPLPHRLLPQLMRTYSAVLCTFQEMLLEPPPRW